jgi:hypothetical protein
MPTSRAYAELQSRLDEIRLLLNLCEEEIPGTLGAARIRQQNEALCRGAVVLLCSHMEGYFEDLSRDILDFHERNQTPLKNLPISLRVGETLRMSAKEFADKICSKEPKRRWELLCTVPCSRFISDDVRCETGMFDPDLHVKGFATPGSKETESLLEYFGFNDLWDEVLRRHGNSGLKISLDAIVSRRLPIAHGDSSAKATKEDVCGYVENMDRLAQVVEKFVAESLSRNYSNQTSWAVT